MVNGRDYLVNDLQSLASLGISAGYGAIIILALYINSVDVTMHYKNPKLLWLLCPLLLYWIGRMWIKTGRGEMHDDPIVFAARDRTSLLVVACAALMIFFGNIGFRSVGLKYGKPGLGANRKLDPWFILRTSENFPNI